MNMQLSLPLKIEHKITVEELQRAEQDLEVLALAKEFVNDVDVKEWVDEDTTLLSCIRIRNDVERTSVNLFIAYEGSKPIGFLVGVASPAFHRPGIVAEQKLCYVTRTARSLVAVKRLVQAYERWARLCGATQIFTGTVNRRYAERTSKLFEYFGYARVGSLHVKEI